MVWVRNIQELLWVNEKTDFFNININLINIKTHPLFLTMETKKIDIILSYYEDNGFKYFYWSLYFSILVLLIINLIYYELTPSFTKIIFGISLLLLTIISIVFNIIIKNNNKKNNNIVELSIPLNQI